MTFRVLEGLPPYGPSPMPFSATGQGYHREGLVVEFHPPKRAPWAGNFQRGVTHLDTVAELPGSSNLVVIAGGQGYVIDPSGQRCVQMFRGDVHHLVALPEFLVISNGLWLEAFSAAGQVWTTRRISWDGIENLRVEGVHVWGDALDFDDSWVPFTVDLSTGEVTGGSYPKDLPS